MEKSITEQMKAYSDKSIFSETGLAELIGLKFTQFNRIINDNYPFRCAAQEGLMERFLNGGTAELLNSISSNLKDLKVEGYREIPDIVMLKRMRLHRLRSEIMNSNKKEAKATFPLKAPLLRAV